MDVFGTIVSTIDLVTRIVGYLQAVKSAEEDRLKLLSEVSGLGAVLDILRCRLDSTGGSNDHISNRLVKAGIGGPLDQCYRALGSALGELERTASRTDVGKPLSFAEKMKNFRWPFRQEEIRTILAGIERLKSLISLAFQASLMEFIERTRDELAVVGLNVERIEAAISALEARQRETELAQINLQALGFTLQDSADNIAIIKNAVATIGRNQQDEIVKGDRMQADLTIIKESVYDQELQDTLKWLSPLDFNEKHNTVFDKHISGTGKWFLEHPKFMAWMRGEYETLWCPGNPGVGKSVMASLVIHELGKGIPEDVALVFIYFEYSTKYTTRQLAEVVLKQLVQRRITRPGLESIRKYKAGNHPTYSELLAMLKAEAESYTRVFIVIDALDEAAVDIWVPLIRYLRTLSGISLLATSRDLGDISVEFRHDQRLDVMVDDGDMRRYIEGRISGSTGSFQRLLEGNMSLRGEIVAGITKRADGMFLLAQLHMNSLEAKSRAKDLRQALDELPGDLDATYDEAMKRISAKHRTLAYQIISWLIHAVQPMTINDLQYALAVEDGMTALSPDDLYDEASLTSVCVGLIVLREDTGGSEVADSRTSSKVIGLVHYTAQEYFLRNRNVYTQLADSAHFAITCLRYLAFDIFKIDGPLDEDTQKQLMDTPFANYAMFSWGNHARTYCDDATVRELAMQLLHDNQRVAIVGSLPCDTYHLSAIHLCAHFGLKTYIECLLDSGFDVNAKDSEGDTAMTEAATSGQEEVMRLLLAQEDIDVNPKGGNDTTPLSWAILYGQQGIVELLLARDDVDVNWCDDEGMTPIAHAAQGGHSNIIDILLVRDDVDINLPDEEGRTPLAWATIGGHEAVVRALMRRNDLKVDLRDNCWSTPVHHAARKGNIGILKLLLMRNDVDINLRNRDGNTPLASAILMGHETTAQLLLSRDDLDLKDSDSNTYICAAAHCGHEGIVELLLAKGNVNINSVSLGGQVALVYAIAMGHEAVVKLLLAQDGIGLNPLDSHGHTPLDYAGNKSIIELLRAAGGCTSMELKM